MTISRCEHGIQRVGLGDTRFCDACKASQPWDYRHLVEANGALYVRIDLVDEVVAERDGLRSVARCNDPDPNGDGTSLCDLWPGHEGAHATTEGFEWRQR